MSKTEKNHTYNSKVMAALIGAAGIIVGAGLASEIWYKHTQAQIQQLSAGVKPLREIHNEYSYINPLLGYEVPNEIKEFNEYKPLEKHISDAVTTEQNPDLDFFSIYFRDLSIGRWVGINENSPFAPGSLMKVAIMITYYKDAETDPSILNQQLEYSSATADEVSGEPSNLQVGKKYTVEQLIEAMIINSDNGAKNALLDHINQDSFVEVHTDLGLPSPASGENYQITAKQYSLFLRILYNATYLSRTYSEQALRLMSQATYKKALVAGLPQGTTVGHKYGEALDTTNPDKPEITLSDCGIVYRPFHPYILCVMTRGKNMDSLEKTIANISSVVWKEVNTYVAKQ